MNIRDKSQINRNLPGNHEFRLNEDAQSKNGTKMYIFFKLTDSCLKTIETYIQQNKRTHSGNKANIKFTSNGGEISIPIAGDSKRTYSFQIAPEDKTPEVFQCIKQISRDQLESCNLIEQRLNVQAQDDVYSTTKSKVTEYQNIEALTKKQTKEIGESSKTILDRKTKKVNQRSSAPTMSNPKAQRTITNNEVSTSNNNNNQPSAADRPLRERLVHILAARLYKKPDLLLRLKSDGGIRDDEKEQLDAILPNISTLSKTGELVLLKSILTSGEVSSNWPFYPKGEATLVQKRIKDAQTNINRSTTNKPTNDTPSNSTRFSVPNVIMQSQAPTSNTLSSKATSSMNNPTHYPTANEERNQIESNSLTTSTQDSLSEEKMQQLSEMLDKISNTLSQSDQLNEPLKVEVDSTSDDDLGESTEEYNRLVREYNDLIEYFKSISDRFSVLQQEFTDDQSNEKASKIVKEFFKCEENDGYLRKRQRLVELHNKLRNLQKQFQKDFSVQNFDDFDDDDDDEEEDDE